MPHPPLRYRSTKVIEAVPMTYGEYYKHQPKTSSSMLVVVDDDAPGFHTYVVIDGAHHCHEWIPSGIFYSLYELA